MNEKVTQMVSLLFKDIEPSEEVQALRDEVLNNCQERFADLMREGLSEEEGLTAVMESLKGMDEVLKDYPRVSAEKAEEPLSLMHFEPEDIKAIDAQLTNCTVEVLASDEGFSLEKKGDAMMRLEEDGTLRLWQEKPEDSLFKGISWEESFDSFEHFGDAVNRLGRNLSNLVRGFRSNEQEQRITLRIPKTLHPRVRIRTTSGDIRWIGALPGEELTLQTTSGDVEARIDPDYILPHVCAATMSGDAELYLNAEVAKVTSVSGDVTWDGDAGRLDMNSTSGDAEAIGEIRSLGMNTTSGDLSLELTEEGPAEITVNTVSGNVDLRVPAMVMEIAAALKTVSGDVKYRNVEIVDDAPIRIQANTVSGDLKIHH